MLELPRDHEAITQQIIGAAIAVHRAFGAGLFEAVYKACLVIELRDAGLRVERERQITLVYKGRDIGKHYCIDLIVQEVVLLEIKCVDALTAVHQAQLITYLKLTGCPVGMLINFNVPVLHSGIRRVIHPDLYRRDGRGS